MILFFRTPTNSVIATECSKELNSEDIKKLCWLYSDATVEVEENLISCPKKKIRPLNRLLYPTVHW